MTGEPGITVYRFGRWRWGYQIVVDGYHLYGRGPTERVARRRAERQIAAIQASRSPRSLR